MVEFNFHHIGWNSGTWPLRLVTNLPLSILMKPARQTTSTLASSRAAVIWSSKSSRHLYPRWLITCKVRAYHHAAHCLTDNFNNNKLSDISMDMDTLIIMVIKYRWFVWSNINNANSQSCLIFILTIFCQLLNHSICSCLTFCAQSLTFQNCRVIKICP